MELIEQKRSVLENNKSDVATCNRKKRAWEEMVDTFSTRTGIRREWKTLREKFLNMKRKAKKENGEDYAHNTDKIFIMARDSTTGLANVPKGIKRSEQKYDMYESSEDAHDFDSFCAHKNDKQEIYNFEWPILNPRTMRSLEEEKIKLVLMQKEFYQGENKRAQEKHDFEMITEKLKLDQETLEGKLRIEKVQLEIIEKRAKLDLKCEKS